MEDEDVEEDTTFPSTTSSTTVTYLVLEVEVEEEDDTLWMEKIEQIKSSQIKFIYI